MFATAWATSQYSNTPCIQGGMEEDTSQMTREVEERFERIERNLEATTATIRTMVTGWEIQQKNMAALIEMHLKTEEALAGLIKAITAQGINGKG